VKLKPGKGLNFPDTELGIPSLTPKDLEDLDFIARHADMVGLSFVRSPSDVERLQAELAARGAAQLGIVLKIETTPAFARFPRLLLTAMRSEQVGVMLARGDMAVEMGFMRLAEVQEELLWLCEAGLVPAIWATQVLESLNKTGVPTRGEVTDAAMSSRAECVMLNQGENIVATVAFVVDVLRRMHEHQDKKRALMRSLGVSRLD
jgi:pyruvate kinase